MKHCKNSIFQYWAGSKIQDFTVVFEGHLGSGAQAGPNLGILKAFQYFNIGGSILAGSKTVLRNPWTSRLGSSPICGNNQGPRVHILLESGLVCFDVLTSAITIQQKTRKQTTQQTHSNKQAPAASVVIFKASRLYAFKCIYIYVCVCIYCEFLILVHVFNHLYVELKFWIDYVDERAYYIQGS